MSVEVHELIAAWTEFPGFFLTGTRRLADTYIMSFEGSGAQEQVCFGSKQSWMNVQTGDELKFHSRLFARRVLQLAEEDGLVSAGHGKGSFHRIGRNVIYTTDCAQRYQFTLEDLLTLVDIIEDRAILAEVV